MKTLILQFCGATTLQTHSVFNIICRDETSQMTVFYTMVTPLDYKVYYNIELCLKWHLYNNNSINLTSRGIIYSFKLKRRLVKLCSLLQRDIMIILFK